MIRFRFALTPLGRVAPWGREHRELHWFGLTDGWYWIELADHELLRYFPDTPRCADSMAQRPCVDYYLARLWEDIIEMTPAVLEPVPPDLFDFVAGDSGDWRPVNSDAASIAAVWYDERTLNLGYIRHGIRLDLERLRAEHADRMTWLARGLRYVPETDWTVVRAGAIELRQG
ncbi:hypothetical protein IL992_37815 [Microbispora sp. NEAU-D428]|uniref:DUF5984 family protein n=1 Tax=Microbispora sitophila TaxID=2771537 RepID=UPI0018681B9B|nr:DUF5984 family protein [Microbispora sitophila]MBE3014889.1 hypothetical protein [Microbispora sitophila]